MSTSRDKRGALVVNLVGGPGSGKSTTAAGVFHKLKILGYNCEYVSEAAKDFTWEERHVAISVQPYVFGKQLIRMERVVSKVDVVITDCPLVLCSYYGQFLHPGKYPDTFYDCVHEIATNNFNNMYYFVERVKKYNPSGRNQTEDEANSVSADLKFLMDHVWGIPFQNIPGNEAAVDHIVKDIVNVLSVPKNPDDS